VSDDFDLNSFIAFMVSIVIGLVGGIIAIYFITSIPTLIATFLMVLGISALTSVAVGRKTNVVYTSTISFIITLIIIIIYLIIVTINR